MVWREMTSLGQVSGVNYSWFDIFLSISIEISICGRELELGYLREKHQNHQNKEGWRQHDFSAEKEYIV